MTKIAFTGGGTAGHVSPNIALIQKLQKEDTPPEMIYLGSKEGIEKEMIGKENIPYFGIATGKLRRYRSLKNLSDPFRVLAGFFQAFRILGKQKPDILFSKGGFVAVPPVLAAYFRRIPVIIHESDYSPGLTTKISSKFAKTICLTFEDTAKFLPKKKTVVTGTPIRNRLQNGNAASGYKLTGFSSDKPTLLVMGGSQGSKAINDALITILPELTKNYQIIHLAGKGNAAKMPQNTAGYVCYDFLSDELADVLAITDFVLSRAGSNAIFEFLALRKPMLLVPLPLSASRGDQILNADYFQKKGYALTRKQEELTPESLLDAIAELNRQKESILTQMTESADGTEKVLEVLHQMLPNPDNQKTDF